MDNITLGIVIPVFGSTRSVAELVHQIHTVFTPVCTYHIYLVDDGNPENVSSWLRKNCRLPHVTLIRPYYAGFAMPEAAGISPPWMMTCSTALPPFFACTRPF